MRGLYVLALLAILFRASASRADEAALPLDLSWSAPPSCASADEIRAELARIAHVRPGRSIARITARGRIDKVGATYRLTLRTEQAGRQTGERALAASECRSLEREVTLVLALAFGQGVEIAEPDARVPEGAGAAEGSSAPLAGTVSGAEGPPAPGAKTAAPSPTTAATSLDQTSSSQAVASTPAPSASHSTDARSAVFLGGGVLMATLPSPAFSAIAGAELGWKDFWFEPRVVWLPHVGDELERGVHARYDGIGGALAACGGVLRVGTSAFHVCLGADAMALRGRSTGASESGEALGAMLAGAATLAWQWPARSAFHVRLEAQLHVRLNEVRFVVEGLGDAHRVPRLAPSFALSVALWP